VRRKRAQAWLLRVLGRRLDEWGESLLRRAEHADAAEQDSGGAEGTPAGIPSSRNQSEQARDTDSGGRAPEWWLRSLTDGPPAHWVKLVRDRAPHLLERRPTRSQGPDRAPPFRSTAGPTERQRAPAPPAERARLEEATSRGAIEGRPDGPDEAAPVIEDGPVAEPQRPPAEGGSPPLREERTIVSPFRGAAPPVTPSAVEPEWPPRPSSVRPASSQARQSPSGEAPAPSRAVEPDYPVSESSRAPDPRVRDATTATPPPAAGPEVPAAFERGPGRAAGTKEPPATPAAPPQRDDPPAAPPLHSPTGDSPSAPRVDLPGAAAEPAGSASPDWGAGETADRWPPLPDETLDAPEEWESALRTRDRLQKLNLEQRGL
jgi:hypothetical protein